MRIQFVIAALMLAMLTCAHARWKADYASSSQEVQTFYKHSHNSKGQWCCDESDGHPYYDWYQVNSDGSVTVKLNGKDHKLESHMVLTGPNPTGHAVWWYVDVGEQHRDYCFAPGPGF